MFTEDSSPGEVSSIRHDSTVMDLERSLANIKISDENPWRSTQHGEPQQPWAQMPGGGNNQAWGGGHMSPQQMRNPWPENNLAQNVNEALGIAGPGVGQPTWGAPMGGPAEFADPKIWSDANHEQQQFQPMHNHHMPGGMNGMIDPQAGDWMGVPSQSQQPMWSDPMKQEQEGFWKQPHQQQGWNGPPNNMGGAAGFRMPPQHGRRGGPQPPMGMHVPMRVGPPGTWNPGNMYPPVRQQGPNDHGNWNRGGMARGMAGGRAYPGGVELNMSVPPPMDMQMGMRQMPPGAGSLWKQDQMGGAPNGMRPNPYGQMAAPFGMPSKPQGPGQFPIAGADDLMWHDPNGDLKKWQRDTGVSLWGDPEKYERPIRNWIVPEGEEEDLEQALSKCPVPQKRNEDGSARLPFTLPSKRSIVVTGWGELPENDPNNPVKPEDMPSSSKWGEMTPIPYNDAPWNLPGQQPAPFVPEAGAWGQPPQQPGMQPIQNAGGLGGDPSITAQKAEQLRQACEKGYIDMSCLDSSVLVHTNLPAGVLEDIRALLDKIPQLESVEQEMNQLVESVRPEGETDGGSPQRWMNEVQKVEHDRLIIAVTTAKIEVTNLSKKINSYLAETGMGNQEGTGRGDGYRYPFIE